MSKVNDRIYSSVKTLKTFGTNLSFDSDEDDDKNKKMYKKDNTNVLFSIEEYLQKENCTSYNLGTLPIQQKCYTCSICNPSEDKYICNFCYLNCHQSCRDANSSHDKLYHEKIDYKGIKEFYCICGNEYKHKPEATIIIEHGPCNLLELDKALKLDNYHCETHNIQICSVCYVQCHSNCKIRIDKHKQIDNSKRRRRRPQSCLCKNECHTAYNEVALSFPLDKYQELSGVHIWPIQIMNILFKSKKTFHKLYTLFITILNDEEDKTEKKELKFITLLKLFLNTFNSKFKTFYYHEDILIMFNYESLITYIPKINVNIRKNIITNIHLKFRLIIILLFVHLRRDFQTVKSLTSIDFLCSTILERIEYKKILSQPNIYTNYINEKYGNEELMKDDHIIKIIAFNDVVRLLEISVKHLDIQKNANEIEIGLKYLCFILKKMILTKVELIKLTHHLVIFFNKFYEFIRTKNPDIYSLLNIFNGLAEIVFMIPVSYNDIIVMEYLNKHKNTKNIEKIKPLDEFMHVKSKCGIGLYQIILKSCDLLRMHYEKIPKSNTKNYNINDINNKTQVIKDKNIKLPENGGLFVEKIVSLFTETLGIFSLADNIYYKQINSITKNDLINYYRFINKLENNIWLDFNMNEKNDIDKLIFDLKSNIENKFNYLFTSSYAGENLEINKKIYQDIKIFSEQIKKIIYNFYIRNNLKNEVIDNETEQRILRKRSTSSNIAYKQNLINMDNNDKFVNSNYNLKVNDDNLFFKENRNYDNSEEKEELDEEKEEMDEEEIKNIKNMKQYWKKLASKNNIYFFLKDIIFNTVIEEFVDILLISNLDEVISKVLSFLSNRKFPNLLTYELADIIFSTLSLYFYTKRGMEYFLMGKNLTRINKIINRFNYNSNNKNNNPKLGKNVNDNIKIMNRTIDFLLDICKGIRIYGLNIKNHKILHRFKKNLLQHISMFNIVSGNNLLEFAIQFKKVLKIFINLSPDYPHEEFKYIKKCCTLIFKKNPSNLFDKNVFFQIFYLLHNKTEKLNNLDNRSIQEKKTFLSLYFTFFKFITMSTFYCYNNEEDNEIIDILSSFNNLVEIKKAFSSHLFTLKEKYIILKYLRTICFLDQLDEYEILDQVMPLSNSEFSNLLQNNLINSNIDLNDLKFNDPKNDTINNISQNTLIKKYEKIKDLEIVLEIYLSEIDEFPNQIINKNLKYSDLYYKELLFDIKYISIFFYCQKRNLWGKFKILFYKLTIEFLEKINHFQIVHHDIKQCYQDNKSIFFVDEDIPSLGTITTANIKANNAKMNMNNKSSLDSTDEWDIELLKIKERKHKMKSINFDMYNKKIIYCYLTESIDALIKYCGFNQHYNLQNFLEYYDVMAESNFTPFSLLETLDYEYFYDEIMEEDTKVIQHDHYLYTIENLKNSFFSTFIDINNTNFLDVITSTSGENFVYDFRRIYINYFLSFLNSIEGNHLHKLEINLCILTKMMFYDSEGMQNKFANIIKDQDFFPNLNKILNKYMVLVFSLSKNIYAYELASQITNLNKLIIQFIQALGEGFNFTYHDNIFLPPKINSNKPIINKVNNIDKYEEEEKNNNVIYLNVKNQKNYLINTNNNNNRNRSILNYSKKTSQEIFVLKKTIYESIINNLKYALYKLDLDNMTDSELPYDKLIILITNIIDFIIEYIDSTDDNNDIIRTNLGRLLLGTKIKKGYDLRTMDEKQIIKFSPYINNFFTKNKPNSTHKNKYLLRKKVICYSKIKLSQLLIYYSLTGGKEDFIENLVENDLSPILLFKEILYNFYEMINHLETKKPELIEQLNMQITVEDYSNKLIDFYAYEDDFRNMIELQVIFQLYILIKIFEEIYKHNQLIVFFKKNAENIEENILDESGDINLRSMFSHSVYNFLQIIILKVEIKMDEEDEDENNKYDKDEEEDENNIYNPQQKVKNKKNEKVAKTIRNLLKKDKTFSNLMNINRKIKNNEVENKYNINNINEEEKREIESSELMYNEDDFIENDEEKSNIKTMFFPRPYLTFFLSKSTKDRFINTVDRKSASSKFNALLNFADYCLYEMIVNKHLIGNSRFNNFCANINYSIVEIINYIFIVVQNILILIQFYKKSDLSYEEYYSFDQSKVNKFRLENIIIAIIQEIFLIVSLITWYLFKFMNICQYYIMNEYNKQFVGKRIGEDEKIPQLVVDYFQEKDVSTTKFFREVNKNVTLREKLWIYIFSTHLFNREIIMLVLSLILNIFYFATRNPLFLIVQVLFIVNIISTLFDIIKAIQLKWINIVLLLLFDFIALYVFMWFGFFFFPYFFIYDNVLVPKSRDYVREAFCFSSLQCYLFVMSRGSLANGGISNEIGGISYKADAGVFVGRFFFDVLFFLLISLYIGKMFLSFIIDTFGELRSDNAENTNDKENVCFICQIGRDECLMKNIDFDSHIKYVHNMWNYVYYLNYLYVNNPFNFNWIENSVWEKLQEQGINWLPLNED